MKNGLLCHFPPLRYIMSLYRSIQYLRYRLRARGRHGLHSPFAYRLVDQCLLQGKSGNPQQRISHYLSPRKVTFYSIAEGAESLCLPPADNASVIGFNGLYDCPENTKKWQELIASPAILLSVDLYSMGLLFFQPELKVKQHLTLKLR